MVKRSRGVRPRSRKKIARANRRRAKLVIGSKKFAVLVTCRGKIRLSRAGRKSFNAQKRSLKIKCRVGKRRRTMRTSKFQKSTYNWL